MAVVPLTKVRIITPTKTAGVLTAILQNAGCAEIIPHEQTSTSAHIESHIHAQIEMVRAFYERYHSEGVLREMFEGARAYTSLSDLEQTTKKTDIAKIVARVEEYQTKLAEIKRAEKVVNDGLHTLHAWERLKLPLNEIVETKTTITFALRGSETALTKIITDIESSYAQATTFTPVGTTTALITALKDVQDQIEEKISAYGLEVVRLPDSTHTAEEEIRRLTLLQARLASETIALETEIKERAKALLPTLKKLSDITRWRAEHESAVKNLPRTLRSTYVTAWIPTQKLPELTRLIAEKIPASAVSELVIEDSELPPTALTNTPLTKPFESITNLYGTPYHKDLDPTSPLSFFFLLFFGFCLSDVGYGLVLMVITGLILKNYRLDEATKQMVTLFFFGGISTVIIGALFGGYFGIDLIALTTLFPPLSFLLTLQQFDPINNPLPVFYVALIIGFIHIMFGILLNLIRKIRIGERSSALLDDGPWLLLFACITLYALSAGGFMIEGVSTLITTYTAYIFGFVALIIVLTQGRSQKNPIMKVLSGILGLYGIVGYFADMLSYSRLMALGLATGALAFSINSIAMFAGGDSFGLGTFIMLFVLVFGHTLNLAISLLGTFINSARLQFVEFFSKFSTGSGRAFSPLRKEPRQVIVLPDSTSSP